MNIKKITYGLIFSLVLLSSCEDVIQVDVPSEAPRLIIDAIIRIDVNEPVTNVTVKVSETNSFFGNIPPANLQQITLANLDNPLGGDGIVLNEQVPGSGIYSDLVATAALLEDRWLLQIDFEDAFYVAEAQFVSATQIDNLEFGDDFLTDEEESELIITFTDDEAAENYYIFDFDLDNFLASEDEFYNGQQFSFSFFYEENELEDGQELDISILGADESFFNYMDELIIQSGDTAGPFQVPTVTVRGNIINATDIDNMDVFDNVGNPNNFALGYFAIVQEVTETITYTEEN